MNSQRLKPSAEACCSSVIGPSHNSGGLSSAAVCASRHNGPFRWRAHQHIHRLIPSIVATAQDSSLIQTQLSWKGEKGEKRTGMVDEKRLGEESGWEWMQRLWQCLHCCVAFSPGCIFSTLSAMILILPLETTHLPLKYSSSCWIFHPVCGRVSVALLSVSIYKPHTQEEGHRGLTVWYLHSVLSLYHSVPSKLRPTYLTKRVWVGTGKETREAN